MGYGAGCGGEIAGGCGCGNGGFILFLILILLMFSCMGFCRGVC